MSDNKIKLQELSNRALLYRCLSLCRHYQSILILYHHINHNPAPFDLEEMEAEILSRMKSPEVIKLEVKIK